MVAGLTLNAIHSSDTITVVCDAGCIGTLPDGKLRRDSLQPKEGDKTKSSDLDRLVSRGEAGGEGEEWEEGEEEFSKSLLSYDPTIGVVVHDFSRKKSTSIEQLLDEDRSSRKFKERKSLHCDHQHLEYQMYSATEETKSSSELAAQKSLNSFMRLASVRRILPTELGAAFDESSDGNGDLDPMRMKAVNECLAFNRFTFAFGGSMDPSQLNTTGLQVRPNFNVAAGKGGNLPPENDGTVPMKSSAPPPPDSLPIRKSSLQRQSGSQTHDIMHSSLDESVEELAEGTKTSSCAWMKSGIRRFISIFQFKNNKTSPPLRSFFPELATSRPSTCSDTSNASSRSKKTVRFDARVPDAFEPAFLSAPAGSVKDRKTVLTSQFGQIQYNPSIHFSNPEHRRSSAGSSKSHHAVGNSDNEPPKRALRTGSEPTNDLHSFPSFAEARTGIYQRLKTMKNRGKDNRIESAPKPKRSASLGGELHHNNKFETRTAEDVFFAENRPILANPQTNAPRSEELLRYIQRGRC